MARAKSEDAALKRKNAGRPAELSDTAGKRTRSRAELAGPKPKELSGGQRRTPGKGRPDEQETYRQGRQGPK